MNPIFKKYYGKSIRIAPDGFSFFRHSGERLDVKTFPASSNALITTEAPGFFQPGDRVSVIAARHVPILVPSELHDPDKNREYLDLQFDTSSIGGVFADTAGDYKAVYSLPKNVTDTLSRLPYPYEVTAETTLFYRFLSESNAESALLVAPNPTFTDIVAVHKGALAFMNRFHQTEPADTLYYICNILTQFNLRQPVIFQLAYAGENRKLTQLLKSCKLKTEVLQS